MPPLRTLFHPTYPWRFLKSRVLRWWLKRHPNHRGACFFPPGHFHSPLLDLASLPPSASAPPYDDESCWEHLDLRELSQHQLYQSLLHSAPRLSFPQQPQPDWRYHWQNDWFPLADAFLLSQLIRQEKPQRILEVGSGFSTAVILDTLEQTASTCQLDCIEPFPQRLYSLVGNATRPHLTLHSQPVQTLSPTLFDSLESGDFLLIDSSHVAKPGSDVTFLLLRILPRLRPGVWVHFHDIFYPQSYPIDWLLMGRAWNESLFLRAFLLGNPMFQVRAFNAFATVRFPQLFTQSFPEFLSHPGCSFWMQKTAAHSA